MSIVNLKGSRVARRMGVSACLWGGAFLIMVIEIETFAHCGWHHFLVGIMDCVNEKNGVKAIGISCSLLYCRHNMTNCFKLLLPWLFYYGGLYFEL